MTPTKTPTPVIEGVSRLIPAADALDQADRLDSIAEHLEGVSGLSPHDAEFARQLRAVARHLRSERTE